MGWERVVGQTRAVDSLRRAISQDRVGHAYIFFGPPGVGKLATAVAFGQTLLCERGGASACGECRSCQKVARGLHADIRVHLPYPSLKDNARPPDLFRRMAEAVVDPYTPVDYRTRPSLDNSEDTSNKLARYPVDYVRDDLVYAQSFVPIEGRYRVAIVTEAHLLHEAGSNAFLKALEEPPRHAVNILITDRLDRLLPTIRSRCEQVRFVALDASDVAAALIARGIDGSRASTLARMAGGSLTKGLELSADTNLVARYETALQFLAYSGAHEIERLGQLGDQIGGSGRENLKATLAAVLDFTRDLLVYAETGGSQQFVNADHADVLQRIVARHPSADYAAIVGLVEECMTLSDRNVHAKLLIATLAQRIGRALRGQEVDTLYVPLAGPVIRG